MNSGYFHRVTEETPTRLWINNPTGQEMDMAIEAGAINMTSNPSYASRLIKNEPDYILGVIDRFVAQTENDDECADMINQTIVTRALNRFLPLYEQSGGQMGWVTMQGDPRTDDYADAIVNDALRYRALGRNLMAKIPVTLAGSQAIEVLIKEGVPICATEVFSVSQAVHICDLYRRVAAESPKHPPFFVTHIAGIFDEFLRDIVKRDSIDIAPDVLAQAGCAVSRKEYRMLKERGCGATMLGGGARGPHHFTELVGGDAHITINWDTAESLIKTDGPVACRIDARTPPSVIEELSAKLSDFRKAFEEELLTLEEYAEYGPLMLFRSMFLAGYNRLLEEITSRRRLEKTLK